MAPNPDDSVDPNEEPRERPPPPFPIAGIGASAGGVKALQAFFETLPEKVGAAIAVVVHLDPHRHSDLGRLLSVRTRMPVEQVDDRLPLRPDHVYVIPPNRRLLISDDEVAVAEFDEPRGQRAPIDQFFRSLADQHGDGFAIILTGAGADGAVGVKAVKEAGGIILVQDPDEAEYPSMPRSAIAGGHADFVLPVRELAQQFVELVQTKEHLKDREHEHGEELEVLRRILAHLRIRTGHDFSRYKRATLMRRIARRMQVTKTQSVREYLVHLREHNEEVQALFADLLISVTSFFRDMAAFEVLAKQVIPRIFDQRTDASGAIRVWVPGCATGEEAYTLAILLLEEASRRDIRPEIQIFATDLDPAALAFAREGRYPSAISADVSDERLRRFFTREEHSFVIRRDVRDMIVFAVHSLLKDPPFLRVDLVSCRNLLIYLDRELQQQLCEMFHYALVPGGYLFLGSSEHAEQSGGLFRTVDRSARIFQSIGAKRGEPLNFTRLVPAVRLPDTPPHSPMPATRAAELAREHREAVNEFAPPSILVDHVQRVVHISDKAGRYLVHPSGPPTIDATDLVRQELAGELRAALHRAFEQNQPTLTFPITVEINGSSHHVSMQVSPIKQDGALPRALVAFLEGGPVQLPLASGEAAESLEAPQGVVKQLTDELLATRAQLKTSRQEFETATENLRAANEELQSINEEYRSTAEELETSKEELQSLNEELQTLNSELKLKLDAVSHAHNDLENLMSATDVGTLFLDAGLRIKRFTPRVSELFNIKAGDEGRPITDFTRRLDYPNLEREIREVMEQSKVVEKEVRADDQWFLARMRPYRTAEGRIDGVIATFVDVTERKRTEEQLRESLAALKKTHRKK